MTKPTFCAAGSYNESACLDAALPQVVDGCVPGDCIGTDKGMDMVEMLSPHGMRHVRPTLMASTDEGSGMSAQQGDESRRFSAVRGASEWVVRGHKGFDIFCGRPVQWQEWPNVDLHLQFVTMILQIKGPHSDRTVAGPQGENVLHLSSCAVLCAIFGCEVPLPREAAVALWHRCPLHLNLLHRGEVDRIFLEKGVQLCAAGQLPPLREGDCRARLTRHDLISLPHWPFAPLLPTPTPTPMSWSRIRGKMARRMWRRVS